MASHPRYILTAEELGLLTQQTVTTVLKAFEQEECVKLGPGITGIPPHLLKAYLGTQGVDYTPKVIAHINLKGGTGKTTTTVSAATRAAQYGFQTCIVDMDPQGSASLTFGLLPEEDEPIFYDVWKKPSDMVVGSLKKIDDFLYLLPSSLENELLDIEIMNPELQKRAVRGVCEELIKHGFDLIMIDCPPSLGIGVISTICAADIVVVPVGSDAFSRRGLELTINEILSICKTFQLDLPSVKILYTRFDRRLKISINRLKELFNQYRQLLLSTPIRTSSEFAKALERQETVFASARKSVAKNDYDRYVRHLLGLDAVFRKGE